jgi:hypothetical protein
MDRRGCGGLIASIIVFSLVPWSAADNLSRMEEPWPALLTDQPAPADPDFAALQQRAHASLARLIQSVPSID